jgi:hypothetical protein
VQYFQLCNDGDLRKPCKKIDIATKSFPDEKEIMKVYGYLLGFLESKENAKSDKFISIYKRMEELFKNRLSDKTSPKTSIKLFQTADGKELLVTKKLFAYSIRIKDGDNVSKYSMDPTGVLKRPRQGNDWCAKPVESDSEEKQVYGYIEEYLNYKEGL